MRKVISLRLDEKAVAAARRRAKQRGMHFTHYLEASILDDLGGDGAARPQTSALLDVLHRLRAHRPELQRLGVRHAAIFGSLARGEERPDSDADILVEIDRDVIRDLFDYARAMAAIGNLVARPVDIARQDRLRPGIADDVARDRIDAF
jgi:uncharacterized protein